MFMQKIEAERRNRNLAKNMDISVDVPDLRRGKEGIEASYSFTASYPGVGFLRMSGTVMIDDTPDNLARIMEKWNKERTIDKELGRELVNLITYVSSVNGVLISKTMNFTPPLMPPNLTMEGARTRKPPAKKAAAKTKKKSKKKR
jgi:hypothetical protein